MMSFSSEISYEVIPAGGSWRAVHTREPFASPAFVEFGGREILCECRFHLDSLGSERALLKKSKAYRKGGVAVVEEHGYLPFGNQLRFVHTARYASNHMRVTADFNWPRDTAVERHFGLDGLFIPGDWGEYDVIPPVLHLEEGDEPVTVLIPEQAETPVMVGHWHRPPLSLVFRDTSGLEVEIGTGMDAWRWEQCLGAGPEKGSFKLMREQGGIRLVREPLMCCSPFVPGGRPYRFKWYAAWRQAAQGKTIPENLQRLMFDENGEIDWDCSELCEEGPWLLDFRDVNWPATALRDGGKLTDGSDADVCWQSSAVNRIARRIFRQIAGRRESGTLVVRGVNVGWCCNASHLERGGEGKCLRHWDIDGVLDLAVWARQQLGTCWDVHLDPATASALPVLGGLFQKNGFETDA